MRTMVWIAVVVAVSLVAHGVVVEYSWAEGLESDVPVDQLPTFLDEMEPFHPFRVEGTICARGAPFALGLAKKNLEKLIIYLAGGGACFDYEICGGVGADEVYVSDISRPAWLGWPAA